MRKSRLRLSSKRKEGSNRLHWKLNLRNKLLQRKRRSWLQQSLLLVVMLMRQLLPSSKPKQRLRLKGRSLTNLPRLRETAWTLMPKQRDFSNLLMPKKRLLDLSKKQKPKLLSFNRKLKLKSKQSLMLLYWSNNKFWQTQRPRGNVLSMKPSRKSQECFRKHKIT